MFMHEGYAPSLRLARTRQPGAARRRGGGARWALQRNTSRCSCSSIHDRGRTGLFFRVAGRRAIRAALARGQPPVLVRFEPDLRYKGCKRGQYVVAEEVRDGNLRRLLALEPALGVGRVGLKEMCAQCSSFVAAKTACSLRHDCLRKGAGRHV